MKCGIWNNSLPALSSPRPSSTVQVCYALITLIVVPSITQSTLITPSFNDARDPVDADGATEFLLISSNISTLCKHMTNFTKSTVSTLQEAVTKLSVFHEKQLLLVTLLKFVPGLASSCSEGQHIAVSHWAKSEQAPH